MRGRWGAIVVLGCTLVVSFQAAVMAQQPMGGRFSFDELDAKKDGKVTPDEVAAYFQSHAAPWAQAFFKRLDADGKGYVTKDDFQKLRARAQARGGAAPEDDEDN